MIELFTYIRGTAKIKKIELGTPTRGLTWIRLVDPTLEKIKLLSNIGQGQEKSISCNDYR